MALRSDLPRGQSRRARSVCLHRALRERRAVPRKRLDAESMPSTEFTIDSLGADDLTVVVSREDRRASRDQWRIALLGCAAWAPLAIAFSILFFAPVTLRALDFAAFYCAASALDHGHDPYRVDSLRSCEASVAVNGPIGEGATIPAPLPPYALTALRIFSSQPFALAHHELDLLSFAALVLVVVALSRLSGIPPLVTGYVLAPLAWIGIALGQPLVLVLCSIVLSAAALKAGRHSAAAIALAPALVDPHLALPVLISLFIWSKRSRPALCFMLAALTAISIWATPFSLTVEYLTRVLPAHASSEAYSASQISLTSLLTFLGVPENGALAVGMMQYIVASAIAIVVAPRWYAQGGVVIVSVLGALQGGTALHSDDLLLALPAALVMLRQAPVAVAIAVFALTPHGPEIGGVIPAVLSSLGAGVLFSYVLDVRWGFGMCLACGLLIYLDPFPNGSVSSPAATRIFSTLSTRQASDLVETSWRTWENATVRTSAWVLAGLLLRLGSFALLVLSIVLRGPTASRRPYQVYERFSSLKSRRP
jgi:hypothetical protein